MELCTNGHQIPAWANGVCPRCNQMDRTSKRYGNPRTFSPRRYAGDGNPGAPTAGEPEALSVNSQSDASPPRYLYVRKSLQPPKPDANTRHPGMILLGIKQLLHEVSGGTHSIESILADCGIDSEAVAEIARAGHLFVADVRDRWFAHFWQAISREQARVIARSYGLDGLPRAKSKAELAKRVRFGITKMEQLRADGLAQLKKPKSRDALIRAIIEAAQQYR